MAAGSPNLSNLFQGAPNYEPPSPVAKRRTGTKRTRNTNSGTKTRSNRNTTVKRKRAPINRISKQEQTAFNKFHDEIMSAPVYLVNGHSCVCKDGQDCLGSPNPAGITNESKRQYSFVIPEDVYIISLTTPGSYYCLDSPESIMIDETANLQQLLYIHSESDIETKGGVGTTHRALYSGFRRATGAPSGEPPVSYPNLTFALNNEQTEPNGTKTISERKDNPYGVYRIDTLPFGYMSADGKKLDNRSSVLAQDPERPGGNWFLSDIIRETLTTEQHVGPAIFVLAGCMSPCYPKGFQKSIDRAASQMDEAHHRYTALKPVLTKEEILTIPGLDERAIPTDVGIASAAEMLTFEEIRNAHERGVTNLDYYLTNAGQHLIHPDEVERVRKFLEDLTKTSTTTRKVSTTPRRSNRIRTTPRK